MASALPSSCSELLSSAFIVLKSQTVLGQCSVHLGSDKTGYRTLRQAHGFAIGVGVT